MTGEVTEIHNPYWDMVKDRITPSDYAWDNTLQIERWRLDAPDNTRLDRMELTDTYSWSVPDPAAIAFVAAHAGGNGLVDPMAGTGYWAYVLGQAGVDVACYDKDPTESNHWHPSGRQWVTVDKMPCHESVAKHRDRVLFLSWPPYSDPAGEDAVRAYAGRKIIFLGESGGGCTGGEGMWELLDRDWTEVAGHRLISWWGLHDDITVYERLDA